MVSSELRGKARWALGLPALTLGVLTVVPLVALLLGASLEQIGDALGDGETLAAVGVSVGCAAVAVALGVLLGVPAAYLLARRALPWSGFWQACMDLPLVIPHPVVGLGLLLVFARGKLVGAALEDVLGLRVASAAPGIVLAMLVVSVPYIVRAARDGFRSVPRPVERAARSLGATPLHVFLTISVPLAARNIASGATLAWARSVSEFGSIVILAYYPKTAPVLIWDRFSAAGLEAAIAPALVLLAVCLAIFLFLQRIDRDARTPQELER